MKRFISVLFAACLCLPYAAIAADADETPGNSYSTGQIGVELRAANVNGSDAKANEYAKRDDGMSVGVRLEWAKDLYQLNIDGDFNTNWGGQNYRDDFQTHDFDFSTSLKKVDSYKINVYAQRLSHNMSDGEANRYDGKADSTIWGAGSLTDFTFNRVRTNAGIGLEASFNTPFFASMKVETKQVEGILPLSNVAATGVSGGGFSSYPLDYEVNMISGQFGYRANNLIIKLDGSFDKMENDKNTLRASNAANAAYRMPNPESQNYKLGASLSWRIPTIKSSLMVNASFANMTSDWFRTSRTTGNGAASYAFWDDFKGDIKNTNINATFTTNPIKGLNSKLYVRYFDRDNDNKIDWKPGAQNSSGREEIDRWRSYLAYYEYDRLTAGGEVSYRFLGDYKVSGGYEYEGTDRSAYGVTRVSSTDDNKLWARFDATFNDMFAAHLRYQFLDRDSSKTKAAEDAMRTDPYLLASGSSASIIAPWFSYADTASKRQYQMKAGLEFTPIENLAFELDYVFTYDDFTKKQQLGMNDGYKHGLIADITYSIGPMKLGLYGGVEYGTSKANQRVYHRNTDGLAGADPGYSSATAYNWNFKQEDTTWSFGVNSNIELIKDTLDFGLRYDLVHNDGKTKLSVPDRINLTRDSRIKPVDKYTEHLLSANLNYKVDERHSFGLGYSYSYLKYKDWAYTDSDGTGGEVTDASKLAHGYYNVKNSYEAHSVGLSYRYKF